LSTVGPGFQSAVYLYSSKNKMIKFSVSDHKEISMRSEFRKTMEMAFVACLVMSGVTHAQMAKGATKFMGNITTSGSVRSDFGKYWNQITGENECKWQSVEGTRDQMNWKGADSIASYAKRNNIPWKFHTLVWGSQYPTWMDNLSQAEQLAEIEEWYDAAAARYPDVQMIDVVNEAYMSNVNDFNAGKHAPPKWRDALGGTGSTGYDWIVKAFKMARERWPKAILIYNDYNTLEWSSEITWIKQIIPTLINAGAPIDAVGFQAHGLKGTSASTLKTRLDEISAAIKVPMYITEYDIGETDDTKQKNDYSAQIPVMWTHPKVAGITVWGYVTGKTWVTGTGLMSDAGVERSALVWLKDYISQNLSPTAPQVGPTVGVNLAPVKHSTLSLVKQPVLAVKDNKGHLVLGVEKNGQFIRINGRK
jgi:endo-1,4-beta-xylanase